MFKFILPTILIGAAITGFFVFADPLYKNISSEKTEIASFNEALDNSKALEAERDKLTQEYNSFDPNNLAKLQKLLPDSVDNIRLVLEIQNLASNYGMTLKDVKYDTANNTDNTSSTTDVVPGNTTLSTVTNNDYGVWELQFSTQGTYNNFINLLKDLEDNLRIVDVSSIQFSSSLTTGMNPSLSQSYKYDFTIKTYWLKN